MRFPKRIRLDRATYADRGFVFHLVLRTHPEVGVLPQVVRNVIWESVMDQRDGARIELVAACLMPDHLHILAKPGPIDLLEFLDRWKSWSTRLAWGVGHRGALWQPSAWDRALRDETELDQTVTYILRNPVEAGLASDERAWPHSWAWFWEGSGS